MGVKGDWDRTKNFKDRDKNWDRAFKPKRGVVMNQVSKIAGSMIAVIGLAGMLVCWFPGVSRALEHIGRLEAAFQSLETKTHDDEKFLGAEAAGFVDLKEIISEAAGLSPDLPIRGITHTKGIVFVCYLDNGEDNYRMVAPMDTVKKWAVKKSWNEVLGR